LQNTPGGKMANFNPFVDPSPFGQFFLPTAAARLFHKPPRKKPCRVNSQIGSNSSALKEQKYQILCVRTQGFRPCESARRTIALVSANNEK
jgi:hypothetical protein